MDTKSNTVFRLALTLSRLIQAIHRLPYFPGQWRLAMMLRRTLPQRIGLFVDKNQIEYFVHHDSHIGHALATNQLLESDIESLLPNRALDLVVDVGCNAGTFSLPLCRRARKVVCIDADADLIALLRRSLIRNQITNVEAICAAVACDGDKVEFNVASSLKDLSSRDAAMLAGRDNFVTRVVPAIRLDEIVKRFGAIDVLKIDIEGFSGDAIKSLGKEVHQVGTIIAEPSADLKDVLLHLEEAGFEVGFPLRDRADLPDHQRYTAVAERHRGSHTLMPTEEPKASITKS